MGFGIPTRKRKEVFSGIVMAVMLALTFNNYKSTIVHLGLFIQNLATRTFVLFCFISVIAQLNIISPGE